MVLNLNSIMSVIFNVPAAVASTVSVYYFCDREICMVYTFSRPSCVLLLIEELGRETDVTKLTDRGISCCSPTY